MNASKWCAQVFWLNRAMKEESSVVEVNKNLGK